MVRPDEISASKAPSTRPLKHCDMKLAQLIIVEQFQTTGPDVAPQIDREFGELVAEARAQLSPQTLTVQERALRAWHAEAPALPGGDAPPVLAICGSEDVVNPPQNADALAARWPDTRIERIAGAGHAFMAQAPERVAQLIVDFLSA